MTPNDIIKLALKNTGVVGQGQTPASEDVNDAFSLLNMMIGQWSRKRWLVYHLLDVAKVMTGAVSYTIGPGGDFNVPRPDRLEYAFVRMNYAVPATQVDYPLTIVQSEEDYARLPLKGILGFPQYIFLDSSYPLGVLRLVPTPGAAYEVHVIVKAELSQFASLTQDVALPNEYYEAIFYNLSGRLRLMYALPPDPTISALARAALNTVRGANVQVPLLQMPANLTGSGSYNIYSDQP